MTTKTTLDPAWTYHAPSSRQEAETALDAGKLFVQMTRERFWQARRNGATQTWKTRPDDFHIPLKVGFRSTGQFTQRDIHNLTYRVAP